MGFRDKLRDQAEKQLGRTDSSPPMDDAERRERLERAEAAQKERWNRLSEQKRQQQAEKDAAKLEAARERVRAEEAKREFLRSQPRWEYRPRPPGPSLRERFEATGGCPPVRGTRRACRPRRRGSANEGGFQDADPWILIYPARSIRTPLTVDR
jgi:hypothetical protein